ncbi:MAG: hypothetical protein M3Y69_06275, partial [Verrucomicrobiota bacterium]|nr:hypothetical protein [Verrucomicrobiota bacterium]
MSDVLMLFVVVAGCGVLVLPLTLHIWHLRNGRRLREQLDLLTRRVAKLEGTTTPVDAALAAPIASVTPLPVPPIPPRPPEPAVLPMAPRPTAAPASRLNLENAIGVKLFAWLGGLALFIGVLLAVSYA